MIANFCKNATESSKNTKYRGILRKKCGRHRGWIFYYF